MDPSMQLLTATTAEVGGSGELTSNVHSGRESAIFVLLG